MTDTPLPPASVPPPALSHAPQPPRDLLTAGMIESLRKTKPWVRFLAVLGFVFVGIMALVSVGMIGFGFYQLNRGNQGAWAIIGLAILYLAMAILYIFPSRYLYRYADSIKTALGARSKTVAVEQALAHQKSFWKFVGILTLVGMLLYIPGILAAIAIPNFLTAVDRSKQKRSMADIRTIATALESFATDNNYYPEVKSVQELAPLLEPKYLKVLPRLDGWGKPFVYEAAGCADSRCTSYYVASAGKDGVMEHPPSAAGTEFEATTNFKEDLVFTNGKFVRAPQGIGGQ